MKNPQQKQAKKSATKVEKGPVAKAQAPAKGKQKV